MIIINNMDELYSAPIKSCSGYYILCLNRNILKIKNEDIKGILYIGQSDNLAGRLELFSKEKWQKKLIKKSLYTFDHSALTFIVDFEDNGTLIPSSMLIGDGILNKYDTLTLYVFYNKTPREKEKQLLDAHIHKFGQLPPFNSQGSSLKTVGESDKLKIEESSLYFEEIYDKL